MPARPLSGQPDDASWFSTEAGRVLLDSEARVVQAALAERPALPWVWMAPVATQIGQRTGTRGLRLAPSGQGWRGNIACGLPLPLASETITTMVLQHASPPGDGLDRLLQEAVRILAPGGRLWLFALNPLAPYRWRWRGSGLTAHEPLTWRRRLRAVGLSPEAVSQGIGPSWRPRVSDDLQQGPGLRAAYVLRAEKRQVPLTPTRSRRSRARPQLSSA